MANPTIPGSNHQLAASATIIVPGTRQPATETQSVRTYFPAAEIESYSIEAFRSAAAEKPAITIDAEDVVVTKFENNIRWFHSGGEFIDKLKDQQPPARSVLSTSLEVPLYWQDTAATASRGLLTSALKLVGIDLVKKTGAGKKIAAEIARHIEQNNPNILYQCDENFNLSRPFDAAAARGVTGRYLLLIHGTGSNTKSGFGGLANIKSGNLYKTLYNHYEGRILAYEHKTFSQNPVQNVYDLVQQLPDTITLDLLSHSRGGLLGEVLARISSPGFQGVFTSEEMDLLQQNEEAAQLIQDVEKLNGLAATKQIRVSSFIRVACPAAGTTLVSNRADKMLNVLFNLLSNLPGEVTSTIIDGLQALVTAVVNEKNNTETLPGIECMRPDSAFIKVLNYGYTTIDSPLLVIAGDAQGDGFIGKMKMLLVDAFYREDNDLVVNTASMKKGTGRKTAFTIYDDQGGSVDHFNYFLNDSSKKIIQNVLTGRQADVQSLLTSSAALRSSIPEPEVTVSANRGDSTLRNRPVLYVLPGIMGSNLQADSQSIWINYFQLLKGGLKKLKIADGDGVTPTGLNGKAYSKLVDYFSSDYYVVPFPYDWRRSIFDAARQLKEHVEEALRQTDKTISFVVHSMGGLVFRAFVTEYEEVWQQVQKRPGCRVLMLGTPNAGSYAIPRLLTGNDKSLNTLAALDLTSSKRALLQQFVRYPGMLELLPVNDQHDFSNTALFTQIMQALDLNYPIPEAADLMTYGKMRADKFRRYAFDPAIVKYIAGKDDQTPSGYEITADGRLNFLATPQGDGSVTWDSIPAELKGKTYYINTEHGRLAKHGASFEGFKELLAKGETTRLSTIQPATRGIAAVERMPQQEQITTPDADTLQDHILGITVQPEPTTTRQVEVSITHGDLGHALYPLVAGHFSGDGLVEAERILDRKLNGYLAIRHAANNYPASIGTHEILLSRDTKPPGAIVVGLGEFGSLTENGLLQTLKQALLAYVVKCKEAEGNSYQPAADAAPVAGGDMLGISYLLIGTGFGGLSIGSSIKAAVQAVVETNAFFEKNGYMSYKRIGRIEIIELYQQQAIQAGRSLHSLLLNNDISDKISFRPNTIKRASGARNEIPDETKASWWQRLKIAQAEEKIINGVKVERGIAFSSITDKARSEEVRLQTNISIIDRLVAQAASVSNNDPMLGQMLYELLVPNEFKGYGSDLRNMVLVLDEETARYPWEMMIDGTGGSNEPIVTKTGFLRQLSTSAYRMNPRLTAVNNALVIGNPKLGPVVKGGSYYPSLPGAANEATKVSEQLHGGGYTVKPYTFIERNAFEMLPTLYTLPIKILHIAAHGVVNDKLTEQTGIVLGDGIILTPYNFEQLRHVPELVFINCCSLGTINKEDEERLQRKYKVAAGIGTQLIKMGVKAVIVAGWEVDDAAALCFSENFYKHLLAGSNFGDAVRAARSITYHNFSDKNTWGAYQCYGDPFYTLRPIESTATRSYRFCDPAEAISKLQNLVSEIESATGQEEKRMIEADITCIRQAMEEHPGWKDDASILEQLAELYKELRNYPKAIQYYEQLFSQETANYTIRSVEQYCNIRIKQAVRNYRDAKGMTHNEMENALADVADTATEPATDNTEPPEGKYKEEIAAARQATDSIHTVIDMLKEMNNRLSPTAERLNIVASAYRRLAEINDDNKDRYVGYLALSASFYHKGFQAYFAATGKVHFYPLYNWLIITAIVGQVSGAAQKAAKVKAKLTKAEQDDVATALTIPGPDELAAIMQKATLFAGQQEKDKPSFWSKTVSSSQHFFKLIQAIATSDIETSKQAIITNHLEAGKTEGSINKKSTIDDYIKFIISSFAVLQTDLDKPEHLLEDKLKALHELDAVL